MDKTISKNEQFEKIENEQKKTKGGKRLNSGRKPKIKSFKKFEARENFNIAVDKKWPEIMQKIQEYIDAGDRDILKMVIEQRIGKAPQSIKMDGQVDSNLTITWEK